MKTSLRPAVSVVIALMAAAVGACSAVDTPVSRAATAAESPAVPSRDFDFDIDDLRYDKPAVAQKRQP